MNVIVWQIIGYFLIILGTAIGGFASYISHNQSKITIQELQEKIKPENRITDDKNFRLSQFRHLLIKGGSLEEYIPEVYNFILTDDDFKLIINSLEHNFDHENIINIRILVNIISKKLSVHIKDILDSSSNSYFLLSSVIVKYYRKENNIDKRKLILKSIFSRYINNKTDNNLMVVITVLGDINEQEFNVREYLLSEFQEHITENNYDSLSQTYSHEKFNEIWGVKFSEYFWH